MLHSYLEKYFERIRSIKDKDKEFRVLVPLCGKSLDLKWWFNVHILTQIKKLYIKKITYNELKFILI